MVGISENHGISKDEAVAKLNDRGYSAFYEKGVVRIGLDPADRKKKEREIESFLREINYHRSYGFFNASRASAEQAADA